MHPAVRNRGRTSIGGDYAGHGEELGCGLANQTGLAKRDLVIAAHLALAPQAARPPHLVS
jgi:hypothetical protein